ALYAPAIFFDGLIQKSVLDVFFLCVGMYVIAEITVRLQRVPNERSAKALAERPLRSRRADARLKPSRYIESENALKPDTTAVKRHSRGKSLSGSVRLSASAPAPSSEAAPSPARSAPREGWQPGPRDRDDALVHASNRDRMLWFALGLSMGALALTRENALVFIVVIIAWALTANPDSRPANPESRIPNPLSARATRAAVFVAGLAVLLVPVAARNAYVGGGFYITTSQAGPNFYIGNNPQSDGTYQSLRFGRGAPEYERQDATDLAEHALGRALTPGEVSSYWFDKAMDFITSQPG